MIDVISFLKRINITPCRYVSALLVPGVRLPLPWRTLKKYRLVSWVILQQYMV
jgi:hypothetical protein